MISEIILGTLSTFCLSALIYHWKGFEWLRARAGVYLEDEHGEPLTFWGQQLSCFWCVTLWASMPVTILILLQPMVLYPLGFSGGAILLAKGGRVIWRSMTDG